MSQGNAAAIRRRVRNQEGQPISSFDPSVSTTDTPANTTANSVIPVEDAFKMINTKLFTLEKKMETSLSGTNTDSSIMDVLEEYNARFDLIAAELGELKETILKLQTFTMDVNKTLFDERVQVLGEVNKDVVNDTIFSIEENKNNQDNLLNSDSKTDETIVKEIIE